MLFTQPLEERQVLGVPADDLIRSGLRLVLIAVAGYVAIRAARTAVPRAVARLSDAGRAEARTEARVRTLTDTVRSAISVVVWLIVGITILGEVGVELGPLLAGAGVAGLAVGFGAQQLVRDVISGFFILVEDQYGVGESVTIGAVSGTVESMTLRLTRLRGDDGVLHHVRNGDLGVVSNSSRGYGVAAVHLPLPADVDVAAASDRVRAAMAYLVESGDVDGLLLADPQVLGVTGVREAGGTWLTITARSTPDGRSAVERALLREALAALGESATKPRKATPRKATPRKAVPRKAARGRR